MEEVKKKQAISLSEVKEILGKVDVEEMDQIQRWTYDYVSKFVSIDSKDAPGSDSQQDGHGGRCGLGLRGFATDPRVYIGWLQDNGI